MDNLLETFNYEYEHCIRHGVYIIAMVNWNFPDNVTTMDIDIWKYYYEY